MFNYLENWLKPNAENKPNINLYKRLSSGHENCYLRLKSKLLKAKKILFPFEIMLLIVEILFTLSENG